MHVMNSTNSPCESGNKCHCHLHVSFTSGCPSACTCFLIFLMAMCQPKGYQPTGSSDSVVAAAEHLHQAWCGSFRVPRALWQATWGPEGVCKEVSESFCCPRWGLELGHCSCTTSSASFGMANIRSRIVTTYFQVLLGLHMEF